MIKPLLSTPQQQQYRTLKKPIHYPLYNPIYNINQLHYSKQEDIKASIQNLYLLLSQTRNSQYLIQSQLQSFKNKIKYIDGTICNDLSPNNKIESKEVQTLPQFGGNLVKNQNTKNIQQIQKNGEQSNKMIKSKNGRKPGTIKASQKKKKQIAQSLNQQEQDQKNKNQEKQSQQQNYQSNIMPQKQISDLDNMVKVITESQQLPQSNKIDGPNQVILQNQQEHKTNEQSVIQNESQLLQKYIKGDRARQYVQIVQFCQKDKLLNNNKIRNLQLQISSSHKKKISIDDRQLQNRIINSRINSERLEYLHFLEKINQEPITNQNKKALHIQNKINKLLIMDNLKQRKNQSMNTIIDTTRNNICYQPLETILRQKRNSLSQIKILKNQKKQVNKQEPIPKQQLIKRKAVRKIRKQLINAWTKYQDSQLKNTKYEQQHLLNTYHREIKFRNDIAEKILCQKIVQDLYGVLKV